MQEKNWAGNYSYQAAEWQAPTTVDEIQAIIQESQSIKGLGSRHSFNSIGDSKDTIISMKNMDRIVDFDQDKQTVTVEGGITYGKLATYLQEQGFALHNLASLPHISVVGACMTGTHGSGENNGNLATAVSGLEIVTGRGKVIQRTREDHPNEFNGMVVSLGALGIISKMTLDIIPTFDMRQDVYLNMPFSAVYEHLDAIEASAYSVSLFTRWEDDLVIQAWVKSKVDDPFILGDDFYGATRAAIPCSPVGDDLIERCTEQLGKPGAWHDRLPHFRMEFIPSHGDEIQSEYFVPRSSAVEAIQAVNELRDQITPLIYVTEVRAIKGDQLWLSPAFGRDTIALHFTWKPMPEAIQPVLEQIENALLPYSVRPHWGKVFSLPVDHIQAQYDRLSDFRKLMQTYDPDGKFLNPFLRKYILT